jgi:peptide/nickel transport system substrate-binding protein
MAAWARASAASAAIALLAISGVGGAATQQTPKRGGTLVVGTVREPGCLNAYLLRCDSDLPNVGALAALALRGAFRIDPRTYEYRPDLVSRVEYTTAPPYTLTYHIRPEARWSDGTPVTARDFVFTHSAVRSVRDELWEPELSLVSTIRRVTAVDSRTARVVLRSRFAGWRGLFPRLLPSHALRGENFSTVWVDRIHDPRTGRPIGNGPFLVSRLDRGSAVTFVRNPAYWRGRSAHLDRLVVRFCRDCGASHAEQLSLLRAREVEVVMGPVNSVPEVQEMRRLRSMKVLVSPGQNWEHLEIRLGAGGHPALKRKRVRQALAFGIDRVALARAAYGLLDSRYPPSDNAVFLASSVHYRPNWRHFRYQPAEAKRLLAREGCRSEPDGIYACDGRRLSLRLATIAGHPRRQQTLELIQRQLRRAGVEIVPVYAPVQVLFDEIVPGGNFDLALFSYIRGPDSPGSSGDVYGCGGPQTFSGYCQRLVTRDLDQARRILDLTRQAAVLNKVDRQLAKDVPVLPLFQNPYFVAHAASVRNVGRTTQWDPFGGAADWWLER